MIQYLSPKTYSFIVMFLAAHSQIINKIPKITILTLMCFLIFMLYLQASLSLSALRYGADSPYNDIAMTYDGQTKRYSLLFHKNFLYLTLPFSVCFRLRPVVGDVSSCRLTNQSGSFNCVARDTQTFTKYYVWTLSADFKVKQNKQIYRPNGAQAVANKITVGLSLDGTVGQSMTNFSLVGKSNSIFQILVANSEDLSGENVLVKQAYTSTFYEQFGKNSEDLIMPTQVICTKYQDITNLAFLGARYRDGQDLYMAAFINYNHKKQEFLMWEGLSFAKNKVNRDMVGIYPSTGQVQDLFSLYKTAPFVDTGNNLNGTNDWYILTTSSKATNRYPSWFYYTQAYRKFDTGDREGDEIITFKIGNQYCYVAYIHSDTNPIQQLSFTSKIYMHQIMQCFEPILTLSSSFVLSLPLVLSMILLFV